MKSDEKVSLNNKLHPADRQISLSEALREYSFLPILALIVAGGPSLLNVMEQLLVDRDLSGVVRAQAQRLLDLVALALNATDLTGWPARQVISLVNNQFGSELVLGSHWRAIFVINAAFGLIVVRAIRSEGGRWITGAWSLTSVSWLSSVIAGVIPQDGSYYNESIIFSVPSISVMIVLTLLLRNRADSVFAWASTIVCQALAFATGLALDALDLPIGGGAQNLLLFHFFLGVSGVIRAVQRGGSFETRFGVLNLGYFTLLVAVFGSYLYLSTAA